MSFRASSGEGFASARHRPCQTISYKSKSVKDWARNFFPRKNIPSSTGRMKKKSAYAY